MVLHGTQVSWNTQLLLTALHSNIADIFIRQHACRLQLSEMEGSGCVCRSENMQGTYQTTTRSSCPHTWPKVDTQHFVQFTFWRRYAPLSLLPIFSAIILLLVHHLYSLPVCYAPPFLLILSHNQFNLSPPFFSTLFSTPCLFASLLPFCLPLSFFTTFPSTSFLS